MGAYENPQTVITDTSSAWTNMSKVIAGNTVKYLEKRGAIRNAEIKAQQKKEAEEEAIRNQLRRAVAPPQQEYNPFSGCY